MLEGPPIRSVIGHILAVLSQALFLQRALAGLIYPPTISCAYRHGAVFFSVGLAIAISHEVRGFAYLAFVRSYRWPPLSSQLSSRSCLSAFWHSAAIASVSAIVFTAMSGHLFLYWSQESRRIEQPPLSILRHCDTDTLTMSPNHALQRTAPLVTVAASCPPRPAAQQPRRPPLSLSLGSLGDFHASPENHAM